MRKRTKLFNHAILIVAALFIAPAGSVFASQLVNQTWLPGTFIKNTYGQFVDEVPRPGRVNGANAITISENEFQQKMMPSTFVYPEPFTGTYVWGFGAKEEGPDSYNTFAPSYPGPTVVTHRYPKEDPRSITHVFYDNRLIPPAGKNNLVLQEYLTVDQTLHWANPLGNTSMGACDDVDCKNPGNADNPCCQPYLGPVPVTVHLHGSETPSAYDGHPDTWWTPVPEGGTDPAQTGPSYVSNHYTYTNTMQPTALWFHDHALGMTRVNIYSGLAGFYFIRGDGDTGEPNSGLRLPAGDQELELVIADRMFDTNGQLLFPDGSVVKRDDPTCFESNPDPSCFGLNGGPSNPGIHPFWIPEFFGDVNVVNGKVWPKMTVEPRRYRFRILNGSNARFYNLKLSDSVPGIVPDKAKPQPQSAHVPVLWVIGTDGGLLDRPVATSELLIAPSARYDVIIDFGAFPDHNVDLTNNAPAPYPGGGVPLNAGTMGKVMQFQVGHTVKGPDNSFDPAARNASLRGSGENMLPPIVRLVDGKGGLAPGVTPDKIRQLVLIEIEGPNGPLEVLLNNTKWNGYRYGTSTDPVPGGKEVGVINITELPVVGSTEVWEIINLSGDAHPIHVHLGQFQLMNRQAIDKPGYIAAYRAAFPSGNFDPEYGPPNDYTTINGDGALGGNPALGNYLTGSVLPPKAYEFGWKDVWTMLPNQVTRIVVRIAPQDLAVDGVGPGDNFFAFDPTATLGTTDTFGYPGGPGYIWHCHILDHEDNEMMRPYIPVNPDEAQ